MPLIPLKSSFLYRVDLFHEELLILPNSSQSFKDFGLDLITATISLGKINSVYVRFNLLFRLRCLPDAFNFLFFAGAARFGIVAFRLRSSTGIASLVRMNKVNREDKRSVHIYL